MRNTSYMAGYMCKEASMTSLSKEAALGPGIKALGTGLWNLGKGTAHIGWSGTKLGTSAANLAGKTAITGAKAITKIPYLGAIPRAIWNNKLMTAVAGSTALSSYANRRNQQAMDLRHLRDSSMVRGGLAGAGLGGLLTYLSSGDQEGALGRAAMGALIGGGLGTAGGLMLSNRK